MIEIINAGVNFEHEPLVAPFGFKGGYVTETWHLAVFLESANGKVGFGLGLQSVLWSDAEVFARLGQAGGNSAMFLMTQYAVNRLKGMSFETPIHLLDQIFEDVYEYGKTITGLSSLRKTFVLNALVGVDFAAWQLYAAEKRINSFDGIIPDSVRLALACRHEKVSGIPLITYGLTIFDVKKLVDEGAFFLKIKIGSDPKKDGDPEKMLKWDQARIAEIHDLLKDARTPYTCNGKIPYYLDANGRYDSLDQVMRLLDHADKIGALEQIILFEEPFPEGTGINVSNIPVRVAADESAHSCEDIENLINLGYTAIALKPIAKTLSMSMRIAELAHKNNTPCFCADLTVNPLMVDWNKNVAARLAPIPGMKIGVLESNGHQNYVNWEQMKTYHPCCGKEWIDPHQGLYLLNDEFYARSGGIFEHSAHYENLAYGRSTC